MGRRDFGARISALGFTSNRPAALGENLILLINLAWSAVRWDAERVRGYRSR